VVLALQCIFDEVSCAEGTLFGCVANIFKLITCERVIAAKTNASRENEYILYTFYLCRIVEYIPF
jgi:hypothetical protein